MGPEFCFTNHFKMSIICTVLNLKYPMEFCMNGDFSTRREYLYELNRRQSSLFRSEAAKAQRLRYRRDHKLEIAFFKCMDGRLNASVITKMAMGIIQHWRNLAGSFNLGWDGFKNSVISWYEYAKGEDRACLAVFTYHFSRGDERRGCAGVGYDTDKARSNAFELRRQFVRVFGLGISFYPIVVGIETDFDALILHGENESDEPFDLARVDDASPEYARFLLKKLYPTMSSQMAGGFIPLITGNIEHSKEVRLLNRPIEDIVHREFVLALGRGFDWFHEPNTALIVGPYDPELRKPIGTAAKLLYANLQEGRISKDQGVVLISSAPYRERSGYDRPAACEKARWFNDFAFNVIREEVESLVPYIDRIAAVMDSTTREIEVVDLVA